MNEAHDTIRIDKDIVLLVDQGSGISVTNNAATVILKLAKMIGDDLATKRIIYRDTMHRWDGLAHRGDRFIGFVPIQETDVERAIFKARTHPSWPR